MKVWSVRYFYVVGPPAAEINLTARRGLVKGGPWRVRASTCVLTFTDILFVVLNTVDMREASRRMHNRYSVIVRCIMFLNVSSKMF